MSFIECYEPEYVRKFLARHPGSPLYVRKVWKNEIRLSLSLTDIASCEAVLNDVRAFDLQLTYRPVEENAAELSARDATDAFLGSVTEVEVVPSVTVHVDCHCMPSVSCSPAPVKCRAETEIFLPV